MEAPISTQTTTSNLFNISYLFEHEKTLSNRKEVMKFWSDKVEELDYYSKRFYNNSRSHYIWLVAIKVQKQILDKYAYTFNALATTFSYKLVASRYLSMDFNRGFERILTTFTDDPLVVYYKSLVNELKNTRTVEDMKLIPYIKISYEQYKNKDYPITDKNLMLIYRDNVKYRFPIVSKKRGCPNPNINEFIAKEARLYLTTEEDMWNLYGLGEYKITIIWA